MSWSTVALLAGVFLTLSVLATIGMARWFKIQADLDARDEAEHLEQMKRAWRDNWRH